MGSSAHRFVCVVLTVGGLWAPRRQRYKPYACVQARLQRSHRFAHAIAQSTVRHERVRSNVHLFCRSPSLSSCCDRRAIQRACSTNVYILRICSPSPTTSDNTSGVCMCMHGITYHAFTTCSQLYQCIAALRLRVAGGLRPLRQRDTRRRRLRRRVDINIWCVSDACQRCHHG